MPHGDYSSGKAFIAKIRNTHIDYGNSVDLSMLSGKVMFSVLLLVVGFLVPVGLLNMLTVGFQRSITMGEATTLNVIEIHNITTTVTGTNVLRPPVASPSSVLQILLVGIVLFLSGIALLLVKSLGK